MNTKADSAPNTSTSSAITVEIPTNTPATWNPLDPTWVKVWEQAGPFGYLALLCLLIWLLTRFVEAVKGK